MTLEEIYDLKCSTASDINVLLPYLRAVAEKCNSCVEFGVRNPTSSYALALGCSGPVIGYDIARYPEVDQLEAAAPNFKFVLGSTLQVEIEPVDFLFIDTYHTATQLERELARHAGKVRKYMGFHDVATFWTKGEPPYPGVTGGVDCGRGLKFAIEPFLANHPEWRNDFRTDENNGLLILRKSPLAP